MKVLNVKCHKSNEDLKKCTYLQSTAALSYELCALEIVISQMKL